MLGISLWWSTIKRDCLRRSARSNGWSLLLWCLVGWIVGARLLWMEFIVIGGLMGIILSFRFYSCLLVLLAICKDIFFSFALASLFCQLLINTWWEWNSLMFDRKSSECTLSKLFPRFFGKTICWAFHMNCYGFNSFIHGKILAQMSFLSNKSKTYINQFYSSYKYQ